MCPPTSSSVPAPSPAPDAPDDARRSDAELVARIRGGDADALGEVYRAHATGLARFVARLVQSQEAAEEIVQDMFLRIWVRRERLFLDDTLKSYLYRAARNRGLNHLRRRRLEQLWLGRQPREEPRSPPADAPSDDRALAAAIRAAVDRLPERCRQVFVLSREHGMTYGEIAAVMEISVKTVETQMGRALRALRRSLDGFLE
jgi:RNA polymerase sigma-70 factor (ECF subfamily)